MRGAYAILLLLLFLLALATASGVAYVIGRASSPFDEESGAPRWPAREGAEALDAARSAPPRKLSEGYYLHKADSSLYHYQVLADTTVRIEQGMTAPGEAGTAAVLLPAPALDAIHERVEARFRSDGVGGKRVALTYADRSLTVRLVQRVDFVLLIVFALTLLLGGAIVIWMARRLKQEKQHRRQIAVERRLLARGREHERERLAREIHDGPVQDLHGLHMQMASLTGAERRAGAEWLEDAGDELVRVVRGLRAMSAALHPPALERFGLAAALRSRADVLRKRHPGTEIETDLSSGCGDGLGAEERLALFRIGQEAMTNAAQHAQAGRVGVTLRRDEESVVLEVEDDGTGFDVPEDFEAVAAGGHYGLLNLRERAASVGARLDLRSGRGEGTRVQVCLPLLMGGSAVAESAAPSLFEPA